jgi:hypothetical protein
MLLPLLLVRQFLFLVIIDTLLTSNPAFARDLRRDSVPAPMMARFIEERQSVTTCSEVYPNKKEQDCIYNQGNLEACSTHVASTDTLELALCLHSSCPKISWEVNECVAAEWTVTPPSV